MKTDLLVKHPEALLRSLIRCRNYECLKPEDKIYSLLGIHRAIHGPLSPQDKLYPNYSLHAPQCVRLYVDVAVHLLKQGSDLTLLTVAEGEDFRNFENLPSWVPDWSYRKEESLGLGMTVYERFNAAGSYKREISFSEDERILFVEASRLDNIVEVGETKEEVYTCEPFPRWLQLLSGLKPVYHTGESRLEVFWRTLAKNTSKEGFYPAPGRFAAGFSEWLREKLEKLPQNSQEEARQLFEADATYENTTHPDILARLASEFDIQYSHALYQRLFSTSRGYLGLGSSSVKGEKDSVWIVKGSRVPLIFRKTEQVGLYKLIGGSYVHGFMQGEALQIAGLNFERIGLL
ncbi:hypothetical protein VPNG_05131 [Cytospora leucostoma]|uniref:Heterokaryon incompatibility domain-containing protein n=1 Tax=Cytospora leucostoma TaxID=1230097 RepID=A0A423X4A3_9PEZI|nr:hypothetical protein VPNG_05131 [Cytospora leucostoma]